jgi:hypothetical protein
MSSSSSSISGMNTNSELTTVLRIVLPIIYGIIAIFGLIGNIIVLQIICANRFRHKSIHLLILSIVFSDLFFLLIFSIVRIVSYAYSDTKWFVNRNEWCKAEMYLLRTFDFVLAYSIVFICLDRAVRLGSCWFGIRKLRSGISIVISIWIASAYVLIPILLFKQDIYYQNYGGYLCYSTDESVPLFWLGNFPRRILDFIDIVFRTLFPVFLMIILLLIASCSLCGKSSSTSKAKYLQTTGYYNNNLGSGIITNEPSLMMNSSFVPSIHANQMGLKRSLYNPNNHVDISLYRRRLFAMALSYSFIFIICQLPYEIYRCIMLWNQGLEADLSYKNRNIDFAIEIPLLILKLINRCINPYLFICFGDINVFRNNCCRLWCLPCLPGCIGCKKCWCYDCWQTCCFEMRSCCGPSEYQNEDEDWSPTGLQTISTYQYRDGDKLVTKQKIVEEFETGVEPYYKNPRLKELNQMNMINSGIGVINDNFLDNDESRLASFRLNQAHLNYNNNNLFNNNNMNLIANFEEDQKRAKL